MRPALDYRAVWRWHFYAGVFAIPFVIWLAITGGLYLFQEEIDNWIDAPYDNLPRATASAEPSRLAAAALAAVPGARLNAFELAATPDAAPRVLVGHGTELWRVYVHPESAAVLKVIREDRRLTRMLFYLHGELMLGDRGSMVVETAASWAIVLIVTGLYLWWPRKSGVAGVLYPRLARGGRVVWRDLHAVTAVWVSGFTLFLLISGLPWAKSWGGLLKEVRTLGGPTLVRQDWTTGRSSEVAERMAQNSPVDEPAGEHGGHGGGGRSADGGSVDLTALDRLAPSVAALDLPPPVLIAPPSKQAATWTGRSDTRNRPKRVTLVLDGATGSVTSRQEFSQRPLLDRLIGIGVAAHEGRLFGLANQLLGVGTAAGLILASVSALWLWWRRKPSTVLGAPPAPRARLPVPLWLPLVVVALGVLLPTMGLTLVIVLALERWVWRRMPRAARFLGLTPAGAWIGATR